MKKVNFREIVIEDIHGNPMPGDFHEVLGNQLYMQGRDIKECELGRKIYFAEGEIELTDEEVAAIGVEVRQIRLDYQVGDSVTVISGPLKGFIGTVEEISEDMKKIKGDIMVLGAGGKMGPTLCILAKRAIRAVAPARTAPNSSVRCSRALSILLA